MTYLEKYNLAQHRNTCYEYTKAHINAINGDALYGTGKGHVWFLDQCAKDPEGIRPVPVTRRELNARKASLYYVKFDDGLKLNSEPVTLANAKALVKQWEPQFKGLTIEMI